jgi:hypothetical protein
LRFRSPGLVERTGLPGGFYHQSLSMATSVNELSLSGIHIGKVDGIGTFKGLESDSPSHRDGGFLDLFI